MQRKSLSVIDSWMESWPLLGALTRDGGTEFRVWAPDAGEVNVRICGHEHPLAREEGGCWSAHVTRDRSGRRVSLRPRWATHCPTRVLGSSRTASAALAGCRSRAWLAARRLAGRARRLRAARRHVLRRPARSTGVAERLRELARARRDGDRADAGRDLPRQPQLGLRRRLHLRAASGLRRPGRAAPARRRRARGGAGGDPRRRLQPHRAGRRRLSPRSGRTSPTATRRLGRRDRLLAAGRARVGDPERRAVGARLPHRRAAARRDARGLRRLARRTCSRELADRVRAIDPACARDRRDGDRRPAPDRAVGPRRAVGRRVPPRAPRPAHRRARGLLRRLRAVGHGPRASSSSAASARAARLLRRRTTTRSATARSATARAADELRLARRGALLLAPQTPLLFMGEEYGERRPFRFFTDHDDPAIAEATREGPAARVRALRLLQRRGGARPAGSRDLRALEGPARGGDPELRAFYRRLLALRRELPRGVEVEADEEAGTLRLRRGGGELQLNFPARTASHRGTSACGQREASGDREPRPTPRSAFDAAAELSSPTAFVRATSVPPTAARTSPSATGMP